MDVISLKLSFKNSLKRTQFVASGSFEELASLICSAFPDLNQQQFTVKFEDDESELCTISSTIELLEAVSVTRDLKRPCLKLFLELTGVKVQPEAKTPQAQLQATEPHANPQATERQTKPKTKTETKSETQHKLPKNVVITLMIDFLTDEKIVAAIPQALELLAQKLPEVKDEGSANQLIDKILQSCPVIANHELVQHKLSEIRPCLLHKLVRMAAHSDKVALVVPQLLLMLPKLLQTAPAVLLEVLEAMERAEEQGDSSCHMAPVFRHLMPMIAPIIFSTFGQCANGMRGGPNFMNGFGGFMPGFFGGINPCAAPSPSPSAAPSPSAPDSSTHQGIYCDVCNQNPIQGIRFKCTVCNDFDLCAGCESKNTHPAHHPLIKIRVPERKDVHYNVVCDSCNASPITGNRFKCTVCPNFDLCATCESKNIHPADHPLIKIREASSSGHGPFGGCGRRYFGHGRRGFGHGRGRRGGRGFGGRRGGHGMRGFWQAIKQAGQQQQAEQQRDQQRAEVSAPAPSAPSAPSAPRSQPLMQASEAGFQPSQPASAPQLQELQPEQQKAPQPQEEPLHQQEAPQFQELLEASPYDVQLNVLASMGFVDRTRNLSILQRFDGEVPRTIDHLINH